MAGLSGAPVTTGSPEPAFGLQTWRGRGYSADVIGEGKAGTGSGTVAVVVLSHRAPAQVARLASRLADGQDTMVAIHHDPRGEPLALRTSSSVALVPDPVPCPWGRSGINVA